MLAGLRQASANDLTDGPKSNLFLIQQFEKPQALRRHYTLFFPCDTYGSTHGPTTT